VRESALAGHAADYTKVTDWEPGISDHESAFAGYVATGEDEFHDFLGFIRLAMAVLAGHE
jgi:hypothetical protein